MEVMEEIINHLLMQELKSATAYYSRLEQVISAKNPGALRNSAEINKKFINIVNVFYASVFKLEGKEQEALPIESWQTTLENISEILTSGLKNLINTERFQDWTFNLVNDLYNFCHYLHNGFDPQNQYRIQLPRVFACHYEKQPHKSIPQFQLKWDKILSFKNEGGLVFSMELRKDEIHNKLITEGNKAILEKKYCQALNIFQKAQKIKPTGQTLSLIGWCHSFLGDLKMAKDCCLKAIELEPDLGDPYNDLGSYFLMEGQPLVALKWLEKAKRAKYYNHREYPYINSGKAYMAIHNYHRALSEFETALTYVPYHEELKSTLSNLREKVKELKSPIKNSFQTSHDTKNDEGLEEKQKGPESSVPPLKLIKTTEEDINHDNF